MTNFLLPIELPHVDVALRDAAKGTVASRWVAALALGRERGPLRGAAIEALLLLAADTVEEVRVQGIEGLAEQARGGAAIPEEPIRRSLEAQSAEVRCAAIEACVEILGNPVQTIAPLTSDADPSVRATAARALGEVDAKSEIGCLANLLDDPHEPVRAGAALSLARLGDSRGTKVLINLVKERGDLAMDAALALGELGACEALDEMHRISAQLFTSKELKAMIAAAIARCQDARGTAILTDMLDSKQQRSRMAALGALTRLPIVDMAPAVGRMIGKGRDIEASSAICAILSMGSVGADIAMRELEKHEGVLLGELEQERRDALAQLAQRSHGR